MIDLEKFFTYFLVYVVFVVVTGLLALGIKSIFFSDGRADYCYIDTGGTLGTFDLKQHVPYRVDRLVKRAQSVEEALSIAKQMACEVK